MTSTETKPKSKLEIPDVLLILGLVLLFCGLGFAVSWPISLAITGAVLIGLGIWLVTPPKPRKDKP
jgi:protein-S-isoprenylcysteine O-methyltransferase Ste14